MNQLMTVELLRMALPKALQGNATQEFADLVNNLALDPEACEVVRENFLTYSSVLSEGKYKTEDYLAAVTYGSHKLMGYSNRDAYARTFPGRWQTLISRGATEKDISAYVAAYHRGKLVTRILEQATIPAWLLHQDAFNTAVRTQLELCTGAQSEKVRAEAANSLLTHLKAPEVKKVELDVSVRQTGGIADLQATMRELAVQQLAMIEAGAGAGALVRQPLRLEAQTAEVIDVIATPVPATLPATASTTTAAPPRPSPGATPDPVWVSPPTPTSVGQRRPSLFDPPGDAA